MLHGCRWRLQLQLAYIAHGRKTMLRSLRDRRPLLGWSSRSSDEETDLAELPTEAAWNGLTCGAPTRVVQCPCGV